MVISFIIYYDFKDDFLKIIFYIFILCSKLLGIIEETADLILIHTFGQLFKTVIIPNL